MNKTKDERWVQDLYRLSIETVKNLSQALSKATKEVQGDQTTSAMVASSQLYCDMMPLQVTIGNLWLWREKHSDKYRKMEWMELLKELYLRLQMLYNYGECKGRELPGIAWHMEPTGVFAITLKDCTINMEYDVRDEPTDMLCHLFCISLNLPLLEREDPEDPESHLAGEYDEFVTFTCEFDNLKEIRDVYPSHYTFTEAMRNILGSLDIISERNNKENE